MGRNLWFRGSSSSTTPSHVCILLLLLLLCCNQVMHLIEGRPVVKQLQEFTRKNGEMEEATMIGSRPPRCAWRCLNCGRCEAVQVPASPQNKNGAGHLSSTANSRDDDGSNYKPLSWKCKCGDVILNP